MKTSGFDQLSRQLCEAAEALKGLDGELGVVNFDPNDPESIEAAIQAVETMVNDRVSGYENNPIVSELADEMKSKYREAIIDKAAAARTGAVLDDV